MLPFARYVLTAALPAMMLLSVSCGDRSGGEGLLPIARKALGDTTSIYYGDFSAYPEDLSALPIGVFDCSHGGFSVIVRQPTAPT